ncbi:hypothetical protein [Paenibacillus sp. Marseille-Q4541]|uniref:hypothetical protein n=1 Tax=Paenibacillus sp. Marseille-Q4541 TaxID=2831522 RepID=UPI001BAB55B1|nr:hypothetical protein [Paenibacillus sp. Marseille-Q4541]
MNTSKTVKYIVDTPVEEMVKRIKEQGMDINNVISSSLLSRKEFGLKVQQLVDELKKLKQGEILNE